MQAECEQEEERMAADAEERPEVEVADEEKEEPPPAFFRIFGPAPDDVSDNGVQGIRRPVETEIVMYRSDDPLDANGQSDMSQSPLGYNYLPASCALFFFFSN